MTPKKRSEETLLAAGFTPDEVVDAVAATDLSALAEPESMSLDGLAPDAVLLALRALKTTGGAVVVTATSGRPLDQVVVDGHAYDGQWMDGVWRFTPAALDMACHVAGWQSVERRDGRWLLS